MAKRKSKAAPAAVQTRAQAVEAIARIGTLSRLIEQYGADADEKLAAIAKQLDADISPLKKELETLNSGLQIYCEVNREALTNGGKVKFRGVEDVLDRCRALELARFIRTKDEIDKEAMLKEPVVAGGIAGVSIGREGEDFIVEVIELAANSDTRAA